MMDILNEFNICISPLSLSLSLTHTHTHTLDANLVQQLIENLVQTLFQQCHLSSAAATDMTTGSNATMHHDLESAATKVLMNRKCGRVICCKGMNIFFFIIAIDCDKAWTCQRKLLFTEPKFALAFLLSSLNNEPGMGDGELNSSSPRSPPLRARKGTSAMQPERENFKAQIHTLLGNNWEGANQWRKMMMDILMLRFHMI
ncbi:hypothetical protein Pfo_015785 [Paulownia fortunei]|nr:hypothetical protein Pfo_015785 [Paulownia fortunei]